MAVFGGTAPYYEKDGALRAHANRVAILCAILVLAVVVLAAIVLVTRSKPPVIIRVGPDGAATVISPDGAGVNRKTIEDVRASQAPTELEKRTFIKNFVNTYWGYDEGTIADHWSKALNMMTTQLEKEVYGKMRTEGTVGVLQAEHHQSKVTITSLDVDQVDPFVYHVFATRIDIVSNEPKSYVGTKSAESYTIHLVGADRSISPSGLLISGFKKDLITAEPYTVPQQ
jgi:VirB8 protein